MATPPRYQQQFETYAELMSKAYIRPSHNGPWGRRWYSAIGSAIDDEIGLMEEARAVRWPEYTPSDALYLMAAERGLERIPTESETAHRLRLKGAWRIWRKGGSAVAHTDALGWMGITNAQVVRRAEWSTPEADPNLYVDTFARTVWAQFDILASQPLPWRVLRWNDGWTWGNGVTWGSSASEANIALIKRLVRQFKGAHDTGLYLYLNFSNARVWGAWVWGGGAWGGGGDPPLRILIGEEHWRTRFGIAV